MSDNDKKIFRAKDISGKSQKKSGKTVFRAEEQPSSSSAVGSVSSSTPLVLPVVQQPVATPPAEPKASVVQSPAIHTEAPVVAMSESSDAFVLPVPSILQSQNVDRGITVSDPDHTATVPPVVLPARETNKDARAKMPVAEQPVGEASAIPAVSPPPPEPVPGPVVSEAYLRSKEILSQLDSRTDRSPEPPPASTDTVDAMPQDHTPAAQAGTVSNKTVFRAQNRSEQADEIPPPTTTVSLESAQTAAQADLPGKKTVFRAGNRTSSPEQTPEPAELSDDAVQEQRAPVRAKRGLKILSLFGRRAADDVDEAPDTLFTTDSVALPVDADGSEPFSLSDIPDIPKGVIIQPEPLQPQDRIEDPSELEDVPDLDVLLAASTSTIQETNATTTPILDIGEPGQLKPKTTNNMAFAKKKLGRVIPAAILAASLFLLSIPLTLYSMSFRFVRVYEDGDYVKFLISKESDARQLASLAGLELDYNDSCDIQENGFIRDITVTSAFPITITVDGETRTHFVVADTVKEAVLMLGYNLSEHDEFNLDPHGPVNPNDHIIIYRVLYVERMVTDVVPWQSVEKNSPLVPDGERVTMNPGQGQDGEGIYTQLDRYVDGVFVETEVVDLIITTYPHDVVTLFGDSTAPMSHLDGAMFTDIPIIDNAPQSYEYVIENGTCTAYSFKPGVYGAAGMYLFQGFVAVDPSVIPYGSLLYITSPDGSFVYGWAIAADVGVAMVDGRVDVDCFFETYKESTLFGKKTMNIYVVKQLTQEELEQFAAVPGMFCARVPL